MGFWTIWWLFVTLGINEVVWYTELDKTRKKWYVKLIGAQRDKKKKKVFVMIFINFRSPCSSILWDKTYLNILPKIPSQLINFIILINKKNK
jgi:hypothetical protein